MDAHKTCSCSTHNKTSLKCKSTVSLPVMQWCVIGRAVQWGQRRRRWRGPRGEASWPPSSLARLALLSRPEVSGYLRTDKDAFCYSCVPEFIPNIQNHIQPPHLTAGPHVLPGWTAQHLPRSSLCWLLMGSDQAAKLGLRLLFGPLLPAPPLLSPPFSPCPHPLRSCSPPAKQRNSTDVNLNCGVESGQKRNGSKGGCSQLSRRQV